MLLFYCHYNVQSQLHNVSQYCWIVPTNLLCCVCFVLNIFEHTNIFLGVGVSLPQTTKKKAGHIIFERRGKTGGGEGGAGAGHRHPALRPSRETAGILPGQEAVAGPCGGARPRGLLPRGGDEPLNRLAPRPTAPIRR